MNIINNDIKKLSAEIIQIRRALHRIPELGFEEFKTSNFIKEYLNELNIDIHEVAGTGVLAYIKGTTGKRTVAFRADIDALSVHEKTGASYESTHEGMMHACGHDGHMAIALGLVKYLCQKRNSLEDNILFIFQPAEEGPGGAKVIVEEGILDRFNVDCIYGLHLYPEIEEGMVAVKSGPLMAQTGEFDIIIKGKSGHGAIPQNSIDAIVAASTLISNLQSIISRSIDPISPGVLTIGKMYGGERRNIIAGEVTLEGTIRAFEEKVYSTIKSRIKEFSKGVEISYGCEIEVIFRDMYPPVNNDEELTRIFIEAVEESFSIEITKPQMIAEDFSYYQQSIPGVFFFLGVRNEDKGYVYPLHSAKFSFEESVLAKGVEIYIKLLNHIGALKG